MKQLIAIIFAVAAIGFFVEETNAQCYGGGGYVVGGHYGGGGYYGGRHVYARPTVGVYYNSGPVYRHGHHGHWGHNHRAYRPVYYGHGYGHHGHRGHHHGHYRGGGGVYYRGPHVGVGIRF